MKTIEQKAKDYDEIIERAKTMLAAGEVMYGKENNASQLITDIIPELRESEDERIRKKLIGIFTNQSLCDVYNLKSEDVLAYLEKQKEDKEELVYRLNGLMQDYIKEGKNDEEREHRLKCYHLFWDALEDTNFFGQKEQKPNPLCGSTEEYYREAYYADQPQKEQKPVEKQDYSGLTDLERAIHRGFLCAGVENVPVTIIKETAQDCLSHLSAEWSDKDKNIFNLALDLIKHSDDCNGILDKELAVKWFTELPSRFVPQPKPSWSQEDEKILHAIEFHIGQLDSGETINGFSSSDMLRFFKYIRPQPHWKPSKDQIQAIIYLASSIPPNFLKEQEYTMRLVDEVIEELKKL